MVVKEEIDKYEYKSWRSPNGKRMDQVTGGNRSSNIDIKQYSY